MHLKPLFLLLVFGFTICSPSSNMVDHKEEKQKITTLTEASSSNKVAFVNATVFTMSEAEILKNHTVLTHGDTIIDIQPSHTLEIPSDFEQINSEGKYLIPGLSDMHVHLSDRNNLSSNLRYGVTSVLQMSGQRGEISDFLALRDEIDQGESIGPRLFLTGPMFDRFGLSRQTTAYAMTEEQVPELLKKHIESGYDFIKVHNFTSANLYKT